MSPGYFKYESPSVSSEAGSPVAASASVTSPYVIVPETPRRHIAVRTEEMPGRLKLHVCTVAGRDYLIGAQVAKALRKETYNLYRLLRSTRQTTAIKPTKEEMRHLVEQGVLHRSSKTASLIPYDDCVELFAD